MSLPKTDNFTAANQDLSTYNASWVDMFTSNHIRIISNEAAVPANTQDSISYWTGDSFTSDHSSQVKMTGASASYSGVAVRAQGTQGGANNAGYVWQPPLGALYKLNPGGPSYTQIGAGGWTIPVVGDTIKLVVVGSVITGYINGVQAGTETDSSVTGGSPGIFVAGANGATVDDFVGDNFPASGGGTQFNLVRP